MAKKKYSLDENNSGGSWWLSRKDYESLRKAGWHEPDDKPSSFPTEMLDTKDVPYRWRHGWWGEFESMREAVESFESATGQDFFAEGCNCCGAPFSISCDGEYLSGDSVERTANRPW